jgi:hypothetical protein
VVILTSVVLTLIASQSKLADHQLRRIQAYYAGQAAVNYALEELRLGTAGWVPDTVTTITKVMCRAAGSAPCASPDIIESSLPFSIHYVSLTLGPKDAATGLTPVRAAVNYTAF